MFLNSYRGPFIRNPVTDEVNEFAETEGLFGLFINIVILIIMFILYTAIAGIFIGFRYFIIAIDYYQDTNILSLVPLTHFICYVTYFILIDIFRLVLAKHFISFMVFLKNPPSDEHRKRYTMDFYFYYTLGIEIIPLLFLMVIEPIIIRSSCNNNTCDVELLYYIYCRYFMQILFSVIGFVMAVVFGAMKNALLNLIKNDDNYTFEQKLTGLIE